MGWEKRDGHWQEVHVLGEDVSFGEPSSLQRPPAENGDRWGNWVYDSEDKTLTHRHDGYSVRLPAIRTAEDFTDWVWKVSTKSNLITPEDIGNLVRAIDYIVDLNRLAHPEDK